MADLKKEQYLGLLQVLARVGSSKSFINKNIQFSIDLPLFYQYHF